ncbi:MAG: PDDEXK nuclease domain-containing protein [Bacteroides cellulosilyticus]
MKKEAAYYEKDLEQALITHSQDFLLELGNGFSSCGPAKASATEDDEFFADLIFIIVAALFCCYRAENPEDNP